MYWRPNTHIPLYKNKKCLQRTSFLSEGIRKGRSLWCWFVLLMPPTLPGLFSKCLLASFCPLFTLPSIILVLDFLSFHADRGRTVLTDLTDSCLSLLKAILLAITRLVFLKHYFLGVITFLEIFRQSGTGKKHLAPPFIVTLFCQHSPTNCLRQMIFDLKLAIFIPLHSWLLMVFTYLPNLRWPSKPMSVHLLP